MPSPSLILGNLSWLIFNISSRNHCADLKINITRTSTFSRCAPQFRLYTVFFLSFFYFSFSSYCFMLRQGNLLFCKQCSPCTHYNGPGKSTTSCLQSVANINGVTELRCIQVRYAMTETSCFCDGTAKMPAVSAADPQWSRLPG